MLVIRATWVDDADMDLLAAAGCAVAHNPISNLRLGSGIMPFRPLRERHHDRHWYRRMRG
jgi:5-methylthioadenosine/S-adenosylhomocysteine deaminase